jgi:2-dehydropantoate 2-reductase
MKVLVVGAGGVGGYYGGVLSKSGEDVTFLARGEHLRAIQDRGLLLKSETSGSFTVSPRAVEWPDGSWKADLALFCVKSYQNQKAIEAMAPWRYLH